MPETAVRDNRAMEIRTRDNQAEEMEASRAELVILHRTDKMVSLPAITAEGATMTVEAITRTDSPQEQTPAIPEGETMASLQEVTAEEEITQTRLSQLHSPVQRIRQAEDLKVILQEEEMTRDSARRSAAGTV